MVDVFLADLEAMQRWADGLMVRPPDFVIGDNYLRRWWVVPRNAHSNVYLHEFRKSDDDRAMHDHPWANSSFVIRGRYIEHTPKCSFLRQAGDVVERPAAALHRIELYPGESAVTLFITGEKVREWGFACEHGWVHWRDFTRPDDVGQVGRGCGEFDALSPVSVRGTAKSIVASGGIAA